MTRLNIAWKFIAYLMILSIIPLLVVGLTSYRVSSRILQDEASKYTTELVLNQRDYLDLQLEQIESLLSNISGVDTIRNTLNDSDSAADTYTSLATQARIGYILNNYSSLRGLVSIDIFTVSGIHYHVGDTLNVENTRSGLKDKIFAQALESDRLVLWTGIEDNVNANSAHKKVLTAAKVLHKINHQTLRQEPTALFLVNYSVEYIYDHFSRVDLGENAYLMVIDAQNRIIFHPDKTILGSRVNPAFTQKLTANQGALEESVNKESMFISYAKSKLSGWTVMSFIPLKTLTAKTVAIRNTTFMVLLISFVVVTLAAWLYSRDVVGPIKQITDRFKLLQSGSLDKQSHLTFKGKDEIGELVQWFNIFVDSLIARQQSEKALRESEEQIRASLQEKEVLLKEIHHRVKNNLQVVSSLLSLQSHYVTDPQTLAVFLDSQNRIRSMALVHETLYQSQDIARIDIALYIQNLISHLYRSYKVQPGSVAIKTELDDISLSIDTAIPCGLILNELVSNSLKHAFPDGRTGQIQVSMRKEGAAELKMRVGDNGIGLPENFDLEDTQSLGLYLVETLVGQLDGRMETDAKKGLFYTIIFPLP